MWRVTFPTASTSPAAMCGKHDSLSHQGLMMQEQRLALVSIWFLITVYFKV